MSDPAVLLEETLDTFRSQINGQLKCYVDRGTDCPAGLREATAYSLLAGGKRLRPLLVLLACEACGGEPAAALPAACAIEMVHTYSLIHDDLPALDADDLRRGRPTCHIQFGEAEAILAGDALLTLAFEVMATDVTPAEVAAACCADLGSAAGKAGMVGGQMADLEAEQAGVSGTGELESIHRRKTGQMITCALSLGARIANADTNARVAHGEVPCRAGVHSVGVVMPLRRQPRVVGAHNRIDDPVGVGVLKVARRHEKIRKIVLGRAVRNRDDVLVGLWDVFEDAVLLDQRACRSDPRLGLRRVHIHAGQGVGLHRTNHHSPGKLMVALDRLETGRVSR